MNHDTRKPLIGVYPGTFDPLTLGHIDIIQRASRFLEVLVIGVSKNIGKEPLFTLEERLDLVEKSLLEASTNSAEIRIVPIDGLLIDFCHAHEAKIIMRGLRAVSDFDYEFQMAGMNSRLDQDIETLFLMASERQQFVSSRFVKEIARLGGDISSFVPKVVKERLLANL